jgi:hypothetical protein
MLDGIDIGDGLLIIHPSLGKEAAMVTRLERARHPPVPGLWHMKWLGSYQTVGQVKHDVQRT